MTHDEYLEYLQSPWWRARKAAVIRYRGEHCERCGTSKDLQLHHRTYERLGHEHPEDVELLCRNCHRLEHGITETKAAEWGLEPMDRLDFWEELLAAITRNQA